MSTILVNIVKPNQCNYFQCAVTTLSHDFLSLNKTFQWMQHICNLQPPLHVGLDFLSQHCTVSKHEQSPRVVPVLFHLDTAGQEFTFNSGKPEYTRVFNNVSNSNSTVMSNRWCWSRLSLLGHNRQLHTICKIWNVEFREKERVWGANAENLRHFGVICLPRSFIRDKIFLI